MGPGRVVDPGDKALLTDAERLKFRLLAEGLSISREARERLDDYRGRRKLTPADYASTTGLLLRLEDDVWVNAPIHEHNPNFVSETRNWLEVSNDGFFVRSCGCESQGWVWLPPQYHDSVLSAGQPANNFAYTHGDRVRLSPIRGCAMRCKFCNIPYEDRYDTKPIEPMLEALERAFDDPLQPARHLLISGGTPAARDVPFLKEVYERILASFAHHGVDIMMVPIAGLFDLSRLKELGLRELSINIELFGSDISRELMRQKFGRGLTWYLDFIAEAAATLGHRRVRSMIMVGLEPPDDTIEAVKAVAKAGAVPVLSPFRPDPATPLRDVAPLSAKEYEDVFLHARDVASDWGQELGPDCSPCTHNTLTLVRGSDSEHAYPHPLPVLV